MKPRFYLVAVLAVSCSDPLDVDVGPEPLIQTDASAYVVTRGEGLQNLLEVEIPFTFENRLPQPIYLEPCSGSIMPLLERRSGDEWKTAWNPHEYCTAGIPFVLAPGAIYVDTLRVYAHPFGDQRQPQFASSDVAGTHRLHWSRALRSFDARSSPRGEPLPLRHRISNEFQLQVP